MRSSIVTFVLGLAAVGMASVTCVSLGATKAVSWVNSAGKTCSYTSVVGLNFGTNTAGGE